MQAVPSCILSTKSTKIGEIDIGSLEGPNDKSSSIGVERKVSE
jgi:hypothetical protein